MGYPNQLKELGAFFRKLHPYKWELNNSLVEFLSLLGIKTTEQLAKADVDTLTKNIHKIATQPSELIEKYWEPFLLTASRTWKQLNRIKDTSWASFFEEKFTDYLMGFSAINSLPKKLGGKDAILTEFKDFEKMYNRIITNKEKFVKIALKEIALISGFFEETRSQLLARKTLNSQELEKRKIPFERLISLEKEYETFNVIQVKYAGTIWDLESSWLDDIGRSLKLAIRLLKNTGIRNLIPWSELEMLGLFLTYWKFLANRTHLV